MYGDSDYRFKAIAYAAAGSDARMNGCALPVVINSGSGNQSITMSVPIILYAKKKDSTRGDDTWTCICGPRCAPPKENIGDLSAYC
ncbi:hypothetical protein FYJ34_11565 [Clostridiaceae bacterium 68-1-5]|uniref:Serine dehydratase-like alpha subunit domain-containing protein n=2 Tax=Suipraeoptans intestinalis TaxID=2606628 RepID=A0A6N7V4L2_9FIRM|nr:hypothetical protein [Suipraeoptans intestinalis]